MPSFIVASTLHSGMFGDRRPGGHVERQLIDFQTALIDERSLY